MAQASGDCEQLSQRARKEMKPEQEARDGNAGQDGSSEPTIVSQVSALAHPDTDLALGTVSSGFLKLHGHSSSNLFCLQEP